MAEQDEEVPRPYWVPTEYEAQYGDHIPQGFANARRGLSGTFVLFVDILGFAALVEEHEQLMVRWAAGLSSMRASLRPKPQTPLKLQFEKFHRILEATLAEAKPRRPPAIVFSDSAFVSDSFDTILDLSRSLMQRLIFEEVPARMGLGFGGFSADRFSTETRHGQTHHISEFYGTAVVRAHQAECCGVAGMRILFHPSVDQWLRDHEAETWRKIPQFSTQDLTTAPKYGVERELNYLTNTDMDKKLFEAVQRMHSRSPADVRHHYEATLAAISAMMARN